MYTTLTKTLVMVALLAITTVSYPLVGQADEPSFTLTIKEHKFEPSEITVPTGQKIKLVIKNLDSTPEEFESHDLNREKIVAGGGEITLYIGPLEAGTYKFFGEFNEATAKGQVIAK